MLNNVNYGINRQNQASLRQNCNASNNKVKNTSYNEVNLNNKIFKNNASKNSQVSFGSADTTKKVAAYVGLSTIINTLIGTCDPLHIAVGTIVALSIKKIIGFCTK